MQILKDLLERFYSLYSVYAIGAPGPFAEE